ncbi:MAG: allantoinase AllB [Halobacteriovoraceae bacterium]|nr:allantoinase AllB [Halobacteriovoraceae bacterium]
MKAIVGNNIYVDDAFRPGAILVEEGRIVEFVEKLPENYAGQIDQVADLYVMPGIVDTHVHINEPGRTDWEGFETATKAAAAGGITTVVDMPLNCLPVTTTVENFQTKLREVDGKLWVDTGFWGGVVPDSIDSLDELLGSGVLGVKSFTIDSGIPEFPEMTKADLERAMPIVARHQLPYLIHAELEDKTGNVKIDKKYQSFLDSRPRSWENNAIQMMLELCKKNHCRTHIVHLSSSDAIELINEAKSEGLPLTVETCPHYLTFHSENIEDGKTLFKCCPPIREKENCEKLWQGIKDGSLDFIVSDHSPCTAGLKKLEQGDFGEAWGGISSLQFSLPLVWTEAEQHGVNLNKLPKLLCQRTAEFIGLGDSKGRIQAGYDADFVIWDPNEDFVITAEMIQFKNKITPYEGRRLKGVVYATYLRGEKIVEKGQFTGPAATGKKLLRK